MCPRKDMTREKGFMDFSLFKEIIDDCSRYMDFVYLHNIGEALLHPKIIEMINYCGERDLKTGISTNATLLTRDLSVKILESKLDRIYFSIDGATKETYEKIRKNANFERTMNNIETFLRLRSTKIKKPFTAIKIILMNETEKEISKFLKKWRGQGLDSIEVKYFNSWAGQLRETNTLAQPGQRISNHIIRDKNRQPCRWLWHNLVILWDGTVVPCCRDFDAKIPLGNVANENLESMWKGSKMVKLREQHAELYFKNGLCDNCTEWVGSKSNPLYPLDIGLYRGLKEYLGKTGAIKSSTDIVS